MKGQNLDREDVEIGLTSFKSTGLSGNQALLRMSLLRDPPEICFLVELSHPPGAGDPVEGVREEMQAETLDHDWPKLGEQNQSCCQLATFTVPGACSWGQRDNPSTSFLQGHC